MTQSSDRVPCPKCQASNFANSAVCWQCGQPLSGPRAQVSNETPGEPTPAPQQPYPGPAYQPTPPVMAPSGNDGQTLVIVGFILAAIAPLCCPYVFSLAAIVLGVLAMNKGNRLGVWVIAAGGASIVLTLVLGVVFKAWMLNFMRQNPQMFPNVPVPPK